jgi:hypothetical protein
MIRESASSPDAFFAPGTPESQSYPGRGSTLQIEIPETGSKEGSAVQTGFVEKEYQSSKIFRF